MDYKAALKYWENRYNISKDYNDPHWEGQERREHKDYVDALKCAVDAIRIICGPEKQYTPVCPIGKTDCVYDPAYVHHYHKDWYEDLYGEMQPDKAVNKYCLKCCNDGFCQDYDTEDK